MALSTTLFSPRLSLPRKSPNLLIRCSSSLSSSPSPSPPQTPFDLRTYWTSLIAQINHKLEEAIPIRYPDQIYEAMRYSVLSKGAKRAPPVMCVAACELFGAPRCAAFPTACALEMVHAASLIHDDLPCMDDDPSRRGLPSNHAVFGVDMAILAGDALFPLGFHHIVSQTPSDIVPDNRILRVVAEIARAVGSTGMAAGQFLDLETEDVVLAQEKKFGEMAECSAACGAILAGAGDDDVARLRRYGRAVGVLFKVVDDILEEKRKEGSGRKGEVERGSYVGVYGLDRALEVAEELREKAKRELDSFGRFEERVVPLYSFVDYAVERGFDVGDVRGADETEFLNLPGNGVYV